MKNAQTKDFYHPTTNPISSSFIKSIPYYKTFYANRHTHTQLKTTNIHSTPHTHSLSASHTYTALTHSPPHTHSLNVKHTQMQYGITHMQTHMMLFFVHFIERHLEKNPFK